MGAECETIGNLENGKYNPSLKLAIYIMCLNFIVELGIRFNIIEHFLYYINIMIVLIIYCINGGSK